MWLWNGIGNALAAIGLAALAGMAFGSILYALEESKERKRRRK